MNWATILTREGLDLYWKRCIELDPKTGPEARQWWQARTLPELHGKLAGSWDANMLDSYVLARSYIALETEADRNQAIWESWRAA